MFLCQCIKHGRDAKPDRSTGCYRPALHLPHGGLRHSRASCWPIRYGGSARPQNPNHLATESERLILRTAPRHLQKFMLQILNRIVLFHTLSI